MIRNFLGIIFLSILLPGCGVLFNASLSPKQQAENLQDRTYIAAPENSKRRITISLKNFSDSSQYGEFFYNVIDQTGNVIARDRFHIQDMDSYWMDPEKVMDSTFTYQNVWSISLKEDLSRYGDTLSVYLWRFVKDPRSTSGGKYPTNIEHVRLATK